MPTTALSGLRSSCEMVERKAALPRARASASSAARTAASAATRALMSRSEKAGMRGKVEDDKEQRRPKEGEGGVFSQHNTGSENDPRPRMAALPHVKRFRTASQIVT